MKGENSNNTLSHLLTNEYLQWIFTKGEKGIKGHRKQNNKDPFSLHSSPPSKKKNQNPNCYSPHGLLSIFFKTSIFFVQKFEREPRTAWNQNINYSCQWLLCRIGSKYYNKIFPYFHQNFPISGKGPTDTELLRDMSVLNNDVYSHHLRWRTVRKYAIFKIM